MLGGRQITDQRFQIDALDGFRGLAVLAVFLSHTSNQNIFLLPHMDFSGIGKTGVFLFFLLSSFLLTYPFVHKRRSAFTIPFLANYGVRRFFRIYPLYFVFLLVSLATTAVAQRVLSYDRPIGLPIALNFSEFIGHLTLQQGKSITWSIAVEFKYYFALPILAFLYAVVLRNHLLLSFIATIALIAILQLFYPQSESLSNDTRLGPYMPIFIVGGFLAVLQYNWREKIGQPTAGMKLTLQIVALVTVLAIIAIIPSVNSWLRSVEVPYNNFHKKYIEYAVLWGLCMFAVINGGGPIRKFFESRVLRYFGHISFSLYLLHGTVVAIARHTLDNLGDSYWHGWAILAATILLSHLSFICIERPFSKIKLKPRSVGRAASADV